MFDGSAVEKHEEVKNRAHILVIRFSALGDVAMLVPVVYALAQQYPDVRITVLSRAFARTFFEDIAPNVNFMEADVHGEYRGIKGLNALYRRLVAKQFTHVADMHSVLRSHFLRMRFNLGRFRVEHINKNRSLRRQLTDPKNQEKVSLPTPFENYSEVFAKLGFPIDHIDFNSIFPAEGGNLNMLPRIIGEKRQWEQWIGIAPFAAHQGKIYPVEQMREVIRLIDEKYPHARIFLFGRGKREDEVFPQWVKAFPRCIYVGWHLETMYQELILMSHLDVMLSMDSANMHMASLTHIPVVSIWGATDPKAGFMGFGQSPDNAIYLPMECRPCSIYGQKPCKYGDYHCMTGIAPQQIFNKINSILKPQEQ